MDQNKLMDEWSKRVSDFYGSDSSEQNWNVRWFQLVSILNRMSKEMAMMQTILEEQNLLPEFGKRIATEMAKEQGSPSGEIYEYFPAYFHLRPNELYLSSMGLSEEEVDAWEAKAKISRSLT